MKAHSLKRVVNLWITILYRPRRSQNGIKFWSAALHQRSTINLLVRMGLRPQREYVS